MLYAIHALDAADAAVLRARHGTQHGAFLGDAAAHGVEIVFSGPLVHHEEGPPIGSLLVVQAPSLEAAQAFIANDPLARAGVYAQVSVTGFQKKRG